MATSAAITFKLFIQGNSIMPLDLPREESHVNHLELCIEEYQIKEVVQAVLNTILFQRLLKHRHYQVVDLDHYGLSYCKMVDGSDASIPSVENDIEKAVRAVQDGHQAIAVLFYSKERRGWLGGVTNRRGDGHCWERWCITVRISPSTPFRLYAHSSHPFGVEERTSQEVGEQLQKALLYISSQEGQAPDPDSLEVDPYPYKITVRQQSTGKDVATASDGKGESLTSLFKRILSDSNIPPLLG